MSALPPHLLWTGWHRLCITPRLNRPSRRGAGRAGCIGGWPRTRRGEGGAIMAMDPTDPAYPVEPVQPAGPARPVEPMGVDEPVGAVQRPQYVERDRTVKYDRPVDYGRPAEYVQPVQPMQPVDYNNRNWWRTYNAARIVYLVFGIIEALILIRVILKLLAANPDAGFSSLIYGLTAPFVAPFEGVFPSPSGGGSVLELSSILAIIVYILLAWAIVRIIELVNRRRPPAVTA